MDWERVWCAVGRVDPSVHSEKKGARYIRDCRGIPHRGDLLIWKDSLADLSLSKIENVKFVIAGLTDPTAEA